MKTQIYVHIHKHIHIHIPVHIHTDMHIHTHTYLHTHMDANSIERARDANSAHGSMAVLCRYINT